MMMMTMTQWSVEGDMDNIKREQSSAEIWEKISSPHHHQHHKNYGNNCLICSLFSFKFIKQCNNSLIQVQLINTIGECPMPCSDSWLGFSQARQGRLAQLVEAVRPGVQIQPWPQLKGFLGYFEWWIINHWLCTW